MDCQDRWSLVDRKLFLGQNRFLTSITGLRQRDPLLDWGHSLLALVFVRALEVINSNELPQRVPDTVHTENIDAKIKDAV